MKQGLDPKGSYVLTQKDDGDYEVIHHFAAPGSFGSARATPRDAVANGLVDKVLEIRKARTEYENLVNLSINILAEEKRERRNA